MLPDEINFSSVELSNRLAAHPDMTGEKVNYFYYSLSKQEGRWHLYVFQVVELIQFVQESRLLLRRSTGTLKGQRWSTLGNGPGERVFKLNQGMCKGGSV
jgi:hypothetical protein